MDNELRRLRKRRAILDRAIRALERLHKLGCHQAAEVNVLFLEKRTEPSPSLSDSEARVIAWYRPRKT